MSLYITGHVTALVKTKHPTKFGGYKQSVSGDIMLLIWQVTTRPKFQSLKNVLLKNPRKEMMKAKLLNQATATNRDWNNFFLIPSNIILQNISKEVDASTMMPGNVETMLPKSIDNTTCPVLKLNSLFGRIKQYFPDNVILPRFQLIALGRFLSSTTA